MRRTGGAQLQPDLGRVHPLEERIRGLRDLPTLPTVVSRALQMLNSPDNTLPEVGQLLATDQVLAARSLRLVNAPYFGLRRRVESVPEAAVFLGRHGLRNLVESSSLLRAFGLPDGQAQRFWEHAFAVAVYARALARRVDPMIGETAYLSGLVHDLGKLVLLLCMPAECQELAAGVAGDGGSLVDAEYQAWGASHAEVGAWLCRDWNLPADVGEAVRTHHGRVQSTLDLPPVGALVRLADELTWDHEYGDAETFDGGGLDLESAARSFSEHWHMQVSADAARSMVEQERDAVRALMELIYES